MVALAARQQVLRVAGAPGHDAGQRVAAVQGGRRTAQDFHPLHRLDVQQVAPGGGELADREGLGHRHAVDFHAHPVAVQAADREALPAEAGGIAQRVHARLVADQVGDGVHLAALDRLAIQLADRADHLRGRFGHLAGDHHHAVKLADRAAVGVGGLLGMRRQRQCGQGEEKTAAGQPPRTNVHAAIVGFGSRPAMRRQGDHGPA